MNHITIIIDKSTFQLLSYNELLKLSNYYKHNITPILVMEILGDLKKEAPEGKLPPDVRVKDFATKLFPINTVLNAHYEKILCSDLLTGTVPLDGRSQLGVEKVVQSDTGMKGFLIEETEQQKAVYKWKEGNFTEVDHKLSALWRTSTTQEDLLVKLQETIKEQNGSLNLKSFSELDELVTNTLSQTNKQDLFLAKLIENYGLYEDKGSTIFARWLAAGRPLIKDFAPYAYHCLRVDMFFLLGLQSHLITTRPTNRIDMEYMYYLPFCNVFSSNDKLHKNIVPFLIRSDQHFIRGEDLKKDFKSIVSYLDAGGDEIKKKYNNEPPVIANSFTLDLWKKYFGYPQTSNWDRRMSKKDEEYVKRKMDEFERAAKGEKIDWKDGDEPGFIMTKSSLSKTDPCYCGSGKRIIDCCIPEDKFNQMAENAKN